MPQALIWLAVLATGSPSDVSPVDTATSSAVGYVLNYGILGLVVIGFVFKIIVPYWTVRQTRDEARADLIEENKRLIARAEHAERQQEEVMAVLQDRVTPILANFVAVSGSLVPVMQQLVALMPLLQQLLAQRRDP